MGKSFSDYKNSLFQLYYEGKYSEALEIAKEANANFKDKISTTSYWLACLYSLLNNKEKAIEILKNSLDSGMFWSPKVLQAESDFDHIRDSYEFKDIRERCSLIFYEMQKSTKPGRLIFYPDNFNAKEKYPLLVALHWKGGNAQEFCEYWKPVLKRGYILLVPQSSQLYSSDEYCWDDFEKGKSEVTKHISDVKETHNIIEDNIIIAGASQGAALCLINFVFSDTPFNFRKFIAVIPPIANVKFYASFIESGANRGAKGVIIAGEKDHYFQNTKALYKEMEKANLHCKFVSIPDVSHNFPDNFETYLSEAIDYLEK